MLENFFLFLALKQAEAADADFGDATNVVVFVLVIDIVLAIREIKSYK